MRLARTNKNQKMRMYCREGKELVPVHLAVHKFFDLCVLRIIMRQT